MEFMKTIIFTSCILTVAVTIACSIKSGEKFSRQLNLIFALIFSAGVLAAAVNTGIDFEFPKLNNDIYTDEYAELQSSADEAVKSEIEERTNIIIEDLLKKNNISFEKISTYINIGGEGSIFINRIDYRGTDFELAKRVIEDNFTDTEVNKIE